MLLEEGVDRLQKVELEILQEKHNLFDSRHQVMSLTTEREWGERERERRRERAGERARARESESERERER